MKHTRNLFRLTGNCDEVEIALKELQFKGISILSQGEIPEKSIEEVFANNKSVLCVGTMPKTFQNGVLTIEVVNGAKEGGKIGQCIDLSKGDIAMQFQMIANEMNCDIGDHKSNSSGLKGAPKVSDCPYCQYLKGFDTFNNRTIYKSSKFFVMPTVGQFITGYLLIIPIRHVMSMAEFSTEEFEEFLTVYDDVRHILELTYGTNLLVWENGTGKNGVGKAKDSVVHAHIHIAPSCLTADAIEKKLGIHFEEISDKDLSAFAKHSYLLIKDTGGWKISSNPNVYIPRQYVRQLLAEEYGIEGECWNWRTYPYLDLMEQTHIEISNTLKNDWDNLPQRIKQNVENFML